jgi:hypothetical protein
MKNIYILAYGGMLKKRNHDHEDLMKELYEKQDLKRKGPEENIRN